MPIKIMVASSVFGFEDTLTQLCAVLESYGYEVLNSHYGTVRVGVNQDNTQACLAAVEECDYFLGIIRGRYGSGITHQELSHAVSLDKPRLFLVEQKVNHARQLLKPFAPVLPDQVYKSDGTRLFPLPIPPASNPTPPAPVNPFRGNSVLDDYRVIAMLNEAQAGTPGSPLMARPNRWSQEFATTEALLRTIQAQFSNHTVLAAELAALAGGTP